MRAHSLESGAAEGTRTPDPIITNDVLYHLSYSGIGGLVIRPCGKVNHGALAPAI